MSAQPLAGLRVVEFAHMVMGPTTGLILADLGAEVIKVEPLPAGDNTRRLSGSGIGFFPMMNRNKRSLTVDLKSADGMALVRRLLARADVLTENFRPGALAALGLGPAACRAANPRLIYCSCKGFLPGPYEHRTALDEVVQMMGGLAYMTGPVGQPLRAGASVIDIMGGSYAAIGVLAALAERQHSGVGQVVQAGLFESVALLMAQHMAQAALTGTAPPPMSSRQVAWPVYDIFATKDEGQVFVGAVTDTQWQVLCSAFALTDLAADPTLHNQEARRAARGRTIPRIAAAFAAFTRAELMASCERLGLPFAPIARPVELFDDPHLQASGGLIPLALPDGQQMALPGLPIALDGSRPGNPDGTPRRIPAAGADNTAIAGELGYSDDEIAALRAAGALG